MKKEIFFKVLDGRQSCNGGDAKWVLNRWMPEVEVDPCRSGYHLCRPQDLVHWLGKDIYLAEGRGKRIDHDDKVVFAQARITKLLKRWDESTARLFACWCVRQIWDALTDERSKDAVRVAEKFAKGLATKDDLDAAESAAESAAWSAARSAAELAARSAAWSATRSAARSAAESAAWSAVRSAARLVQTRQLMKVLGINIKTGDLK